MEFRVLGPFEVAVSGRVTGLVGPRLRAVLALLVAGSGRVVSVGALARGLWGADVPPDADRTVRKYVSRLRKELLAACPGSDGDLIATRSPGYLLRLGPDALDATRFGQLATAGRQALDAGQPAVARATGDRPAEITALNVLGWTDYLSGRYGRATNWHNQALRLARASGHRDGEVVALTGLGGIHRIQGRYESAADCFTQALLAARATGSRNCELAALGGLGRAHLAQGQHAAAADSYRQALHLAHETGDRNWQFEGHLGLGRTHHAAGRSDHAVLAHQQALALAIDLDQPADQARARDSLAHAQEALGHRDAARHHWEQALGILAALDTPAAEDLTRTDIHASLAALAAPAGSPAGRGARWPAAQHRPS